MFLRPDLQGERLLVVILALLLPSVAFAQRESTREALARAEETLAARVEDGVLNLKEFEPSIIVSVVPAFEESRMWYPTAATEALVRVFGAASLRSCEACLAPRLYVEEGRVEQNFESPTLPEIVRLDENSRGNSPPAKTAIWLDETPAGVSLRIVELRNARIVLAENFDATLNEASRTRSNFTLTQELERRSRGDSITHAFLDVAVYPGQHVSLDWDEQWGDGNRNLSGVTLSLFDPVVGVGGTYYRVVPQALNLMVGAKVILSIPTALIQSVSAEGGQLVDPLLTAVGVVRIPIFSSNYGLILTASTNGRFGVGLSLMNISLLPVIP